MAFFRRLFPAHESFRDILFRSLRAEVSLDEVESCLRRFRRRFEVTEGDHWITFDDGTTQIRRADEIHCLRVAAICC